MTAGCTKDNHPGPGAGRLAYGTPTLTLFGDVRSLTESGSAGMNEGGGKGNMGPDRMA